MIEPVNFFITLIKLVITAFSFQAVSTITATRMSVILHWLSTDCAKFYNHLHYLTTKAAHPDGFA